MSPGSPAVFSIDVDGRLKIPRALVPKWLRGEKPIAYLVPLRWKRDTQIPQGHELEAWIAWNPAIDVSGWRVSPESLLSADISDSREQSLRSIMYEARVDDKDRLCCAGLLASLAKIAGPLVWVAPECDSLSIWTNFAFQASHGSQRDY